MSKPLLEAKNIYVSLTDREPHRYAVEGVSFKIFKNQSIGIVGESGSGKSQLVTSVFGLNRTYPGLISGNVYWNGEEILNANFVQSKSTWNKSKYIIVKQKYFKRQKKQIFKNLLGQKVAFLFQEPKSSLVPYQTIKEHFKESAIAIYGAYNERINDRVKSDLSRLGFGKDHNIFDKYPQELSGGEAQRILLALSILGRPDLLIADEPTSALDPVNQIELINLLREIVDEHQMNLIFITHDIHLIELITDKIMVMKNGKCVEEVRTEELYDNSVGKSEYTNELFECSKELWNVNLFSDKQVS